MSRPCTYPARFVSVSTLYLPRKERHKPAVVGHHSGDGCVCSHETVDLSSLLNFVRQRVLQIGDT